ncbi:MAG: 50S ribosomal protein L9 [Bdellovibrionales bacterium]|nr:50S ribosomal protein L9 [Bdellovibrionales bacterium]
MKVVLKKEVRDLGRTGDLVNVKEGYARNFLFPRNLAVVATEGNVKELEHWKRVTDARKATEKKEKAQLLDTVKKTTVTFKMAAGEKDKLFGSVTSKDIADQLAKQGYSIDKKDISIPEPIKVLGQHKALIKFAEDLQAEIAVSVERTEEAKA